MKEQKRRYFARFRADLLSAMSGTGPAELEYNYFGPDGTPFSVSAVWKKPVKEIEGVSFVDEWGRLKEDLGELEVGLRPVEGNLISEDGYQKILDSARKLRFHEVALLFQKEGLYARPVTSKDICLMTESGRQEFRYGWVFFRDGDDEAAVGISLDVYRAHLEDPLVREDLAGKLAERCGTYLTNLTALETGRKPPELRRDPLEIY